MGRYASKLFLLLAVVAAGGAGAVAGAPRAAAERPLTVVFRFDDYSAKSDTALETSILAAFRRARIPLTVSVIPRMAAVSAFDPAPQKGLPLPPDKIQLLREALRDGDVEIALHGYAHQTVRRKIGSAYLEPFGRYHSEFIGVDEATQRRKILEGREILERELGARIETFVPPWNGYDRTTLRVLAAAGFRVFSAARRGPVDLASPLRFLPRTCDLWEVESAVQEARRAPSPDALIVVLFHHYDFKESDAQAGRIDLAELDRILSWVARQSDLRALTLAEAARAVPDLGARQFYWNRNALLWQITPPWVNRVIHGPPRGVYQDLAAARRAKLFLWIVVIAVYGALALGGFLLARGGFRWWIRPRRLLALAARLLACLALLALVLYVFSDLEPYWAGIAAIALAAGGCAGLF